MAMASTDGKWVDLWNTDCHLSSKTNWRYTWRITILLAHTQTQSWCMPVWKNHLPWLIKRCALLSPMSVSGNLSLFLNKFKFQCSGSTCVSLLTYGRKIFIANVGDSRAIIARCLIGSDQVSADALTNDHKPDDPNEAKVILANNGRIDSYRD